MIRQEQYYTLPTIHMNEFNEDTLKKYEVARNRWREERLERLNSACSLPRKVVVATEVYVRNQDVVVEVLERANSICERCGATAPFIRASDETPYLEVHHKKRLADGGEDTVENTIAVCPNCHRELHFGGLDKR